MEVRKILLASDEIDVFLQLEGIFTLQNGIEVLMARTADQLIEKTQRENPGLILIDYDMPEAFGGRLQRQVQALLPSSDVPVIPVVSGEDVETWKSNGAEGDGVYITKPIDPQDFLRTISPHLDERRAAPRVPVRLHIQYGIEGRDVLTDYSVNLSSGGVYIETLDVLPAETPLFLEFSLPETGRTIRCKGRVAWANHPEKILSPGLPPGMGVQFLGLGLQEMRSLREFLKKETLEPSW